MEDRFLKMKVIWNDADMFELGIIASNGTYSGKTEVYETQDSLLRFANSLRGFPNGNKTLTHSCGKKGDYAFFEMKVYQIGLSGIVGMQISLEENVYSTSFRAEEKAKLIMELIVEPNAIDKFQKELVTLANTEEGIAELIGIEKHSSNIL